ncbi:MAG: sigma-70 family RNA polymerase sigma factor [Flavobacteriales bacterium]|jgi:RNA polymerase sigma-70 factor (ECF subfamily)|nr:sigma-70 family RNA polymerase sigma factor [Flavobacteriales bacterium]
MAFFRKAYRELGDERLMELVRGGDEQAFAALYDRYKHRVLNYFHRMLWSDREMAQDQLQELFTKLARRPESYDPARPFSTWLFSVANNMCKNAYRHHAVVRQAAEHLRHEPDRVEAQAGRAVDHGLFRARLDAELARLEPDHKATFVMRFDEDLPIKEIAAIMECSEGTVKSRIFYTLKKLAERLKEFGPNPIASHGTA